MRNAYRFTYILLGLLLIVGTVAVALPPNFGFVAIDHF